MTDNSSPASAHAFGLGSKPPHTFGGDELFATLQTGAEGLSTEEAARRLGLAGPNEIQHERETPWWEMVLHQFRDPLIYILLFGGVLTLVLRHYTDAGIIFAVVIINAVLGLIQEVRAQKAMRALADMSAPRAEVVRDGEVQEIASRDLVPGDLVVLASGARVPADLRLVKVRELDVDESALTGESVPTRKTTEALVPESLVPGDRTNVAFAGTVVTRGRGRGVVVQTGAGTELGRIASSVRDIGRVRTPLQDNIARMGRWIGVAIILLSGVVVGAGLLRGMPVAEILIAAVALAVATIPEGLPIVLTITLAIGVRRMAHRKAIIRSLPAVETLGSTTVIGSDKTGTLTRNEMTVRAIWAGGREYEVSGTGYSRSGAIEHEGSSISAKDDIPLLRTLLAGTLANEADLESVEEGNPRGDPTELALHVATLKGGLSTNDVRQGRKELDLIPFESEHRYMATLNEGSEGNIIYLKGAPEVVLSHCARQAAGNGDLELDSDAIRNAASEFGRRGLRVMAMAYKPFTGSTLPRGNLDKDFVFAGLQGMEDPVRPEAVEAVKAVQEAGIRVLMLTGDHIGTATAIGGQLGLGGGSAVEGSRIESISDAELDEILATSNVFARVAPEHKLRIVKRLKARGEIVAVTGDGVNDAPALRAAHLGVAMGKGGTDVAREASSMVLQDDNFATIAAAVEEGRIVFANIRKVTFFLLSTGVAMPMVILTALFAGWPLPFLAGQILWINLVTNGLQDIALAFEPGEPGQLKRPPRSADEGIVSRRILERLVGVGVVLAAGTLGIFWWTLRATDDLAYAQSVAMTQMVVFQFFHVFNCRSLDRSILRVPLFSNRFLFVSIVAAVLAHISVLHLPFMQNIFRTQPLSLEMWGTILLIGTLVIIGGELDKWRNRHDHTPLG
jgi:magnesium-transporting ATPase (P-type)